MSPKEGTSCEGGLRVWIQTSALVGNKLSFPPSSVTCLPDVSPPRVLLGESGKEVSLRMAISSLYSAHKCPFSQKAEGDLAEAGVLQHCWVFTVRYAPTSSVGHALAFHPW